MNSYIPELSLIVAALAVFVGPIISWIVSHQQIKASFAAANKQLVTPMRQSWINNLRDLLAQLLSKTLHYHVAGFEERTDQEYQELILLEQKILMMLNPNEEDHRQMEHLIRKAISSMERGKEGEEEFIAAHQSLLPLSRRILKREWDRVKE